MPDKLTDNEIKKALECCLKNECEKCPFKDNEVCQIELMKLLFDLINRLQAENERLKAKVENTQIGYNFAKDEIKNLKKDKYKLQKALNQSEDYRVIAKAEAYKEFAERLKKCSFTVEYSIYDDIEVIRVDDIEDLLKELVGEQPTPNNVKCIDCEYLEFKTPYGVCGEGYMGIVHPDDSCGKGKLKETVEEEK